MFDSVAVGVVVHWLCYFVACVAAYRATAFIHEITHQKNNKRFDQRFVTFWNLTAGAIALMPSPRFNVHLKHHAIGIFGTSADPQYPLLKKNGKWHIGWAILLFIVLPLVLPLINFVRILIPAKSMKFQLLFLFKRDFDLSEEEEVMVVNLDWYYCFTTGTLIWFYPWQYYLVSVGAWFLSSLRIPLEHSLEFHLEGSNLNDQANDSYDFQRTWRKPLRSFYSFIIQPLGLNWHQKHHKSPSKYYWQLKE